MQEVLPGGEEEQPTTRQGHLGVSHHAELTKEELAAADNDKGLALWLREQRAIRSSHS